MSVCQHRGRAGQEKSSNEASQQGATGGERQSCQATVRQFSNEEDKTALEGALLFTFSYLKIGPVRLGLLYQSDVALKWILHDSKIRPAAAVGKQFCCCLARASW